MIVEVTGAHWSDRWPIPFNKEEACNPAFETIYDVVMVELAFKLNTIIA